MSLEESEKCRAQTQDAVVGQPRLVFFLDHPIQLGRLQHSSLSTHPYFGPSLRCRC